MVSIVTPRDELLAPPQSIESEQSVIGGLLLTNGQAYDRIDFLKPEHFHSSLNRRIYEQIVGLVERGKPADGLTVREALGGEGEYLGQLVANTPSSANIRHYAEAVRSRWMLRQIMATANQAISDAHLHNADPKAIAEAAEAAFLAVLDTSRGGEDISFADAVKRAVDAREAPETSVLPTGLHNLDRILKGGGMKPGQLIVIAGRPSMGKTALAFNIAEHVAVTRPVLGFSLEMENADVAERSLAYHSGLTNQDQAVRYLMASKLRLDDSPAVSLGHIRLRARRMKRKHGLALIVVDYLQLMSGKGDNREQEISGMSRGLKSIAKELQVPVLLLSQLNRSVEQRQDKRPMMSDLRESGAIEQDADTVIMLYRDEYYDPENSHAKGLAEAIFRKQRGGRVGTAWLSFDPETTRFHDYSGPTPQLPARAKVSNFNDYKSKAAGD